MNDCNRMDHIEQTVRHKARATEQVPMTLRNYVSQRLESTIILNVIGIQRDTRDDDTDDCTTNQTQPPVAGW